MIIRYVIISSLFISSRSLHIHTYIQTYIHTYLPLGSFELRQDLIFPAGDLEDGRQPVCMYVSHQSVTIIYLPTYLWLATSGSITALESSTSSHEARPTYLPTYLPLAGYIRVHHRARFVHIIT